MSSSFADLRRNWRASRWRSQARTLWQRYRDVAELGDEHEVYMRLKEFLESFRTQYQEVTTAIGDNSETMDRLYGDCTEILHSLLDYVDRELKLPASDGSDSAPASAPAPPEQTDAAAAEASRLAKHRVLELVPEALRAAELILRDKRYVQAPPPPPGATAEGPDSPHCSFRPPCRHARPMLPAASAAAQAIKDSPATIGRILSLLERLQTSELRGACGLAMQLISRLSSSPEARRHSSSTSTTRSFSSPQPLVTTSSPFCRCGARSGASRASRDSSALASTAMTRCREKCRAPRARPSLPDLVLISPWPRP
jgi:hypothetical protein